MRAHSPEHLQGPISDIRMGPCSACEESKPDPVLDGHLSPVDSRQPASFLKKAGALYPGLGEQRRRPCLRLQQAGVTAFHPASEDAGFVSVALSIRPFFKDRPRLAPGTLLCAVWTFLSDPV